MPARSLFAVAALALISPAPAPAQQPAAKGAAGCTRDEDVIYGRRDGHALTLDVFAPKDKPNGRGVVLCVSAGFESGKDLLKWVHPLATTDLLNRGYTVFAVMHSSQPRYTVPEILDDIHRAVRFVKANAARYKIDPDRLGMAGASSGGHLSLMMGCAGKPGDPKATDPVERQSSKVAAVACFFPPTDFLEFDRPDLSPGREAFRSLFDVREIDPKTGKLERVTPERRTQFGRDCSPLYCATKDAVPTLVIHGDKDELIPLKQSQCLIEKLKTCGVVCELDVKKGMGHSAVAAARHLPQLTDWFDKYLLAKK